MVISSKPLSETLWEPVRLNTLMAFRRGELVYTGRSHRNEFINLTGYRTGSMNEVLKGL